MIIDDQKPMLSSAVHLLVVIPQAIKCGKVILGTPDEPRRCEEAGVV